MDLSQSTNCPQLWYELGLDQRYHALWHLDWPDTSHLLWPDPIHYIKKTESYQSVRQIFVIGQEGAAVDFVQHDSRFHVWESVLGINHARCQPYLFWFDWVKLVAKDMDGLNQLTDKKSADTPYHFDCLLGQSRPHRDFIFDRAMSSDRILLTYQARLDWVAGSDLDPIPNVDFDSHFQVLYKRDCTCNLSVIIPCKIYNRSWFTIVAETFPDKIFLTEKTAKPLIAGRLFVWFGAKHGLKNLRALGYQTFDNVIDESYDDIEDDVTRWSQAWAQVQYLLLQDPKIINDKVAGRLAHNQRMMMHIDHYHVMTNQIKALAVASQPVTTDV